MPTTTELILPELVEDFTLGTELSLADGQFILEGLPDEIAKTITESTPLHEFDTMKLCSILREVELPYHADNLPDKIKSYWKPRTVRLSDKYSMLVCTPEQFLLRPTMTNLKSCHCVINSDHGYRAGNLRYMMNPYWGCILIFKTGTTKRAYSQFLKDQDSDSHKEILAEEFPEIDSVLADTPNAIVSFNVYRTRTGIFVSGSYGDRDNNCEIVPLMLKELLKEANWVGFKGCSLGYSYYALANVAPVSILDPDCEDSYPYPHIYIDRGDVDDIYTNQSVTTRYKGILDDISVPPNFRVSTRWYDDRTAVMTDGFFIRESQDTFDIILGDFSPALEHLKENRDDFVEFDKDDLDSTRDVFAGRF